MQSVGEDILRFAYPSIFSCHIMWILENIIFYRSLVQIQNHVLGFYLSLCITPFHFLENSFSLLRKLLFKFQILESSFSLLSLCFLITHGLCLWLWKWLFGYPLLYTLRHRSLTLSPAYNFLYVKSGNLKSGYVI